MGKMKLPGRSKAAGGASRKTSGLFGDVGAGRKQPGGKRGMMAVQGVPDLGADTDSEDILQEGATDAFKQRRDKVSLAVSSSDEDAAEDDERAVLDLDEDDDEDEDLDEDDLLEEAMQRGGRMGKLAQQAKQLGAKQKLLRGEDDSDDDVPVKAGRTMKESSDAGNLSWGANKRAYYDADDVDPDDDEARAAEEQEVMALQRSRAARTRAADYGLSDDEDGEDDEDEEEDEDEEDEDAAAGTMGAAAKHMMTAQQQQQQQQQQPNGKAAAAAPAAKKGAPRGPQTVVVEEVAKDLSTLTADERSAALLADAPELLALIEDLQASLAEVRHRVGPLLHEVRAGKLATAEGLSYLEAKHLLMLQYCAHIVFYLMLKAEGRPVRDHPVITRLVEIRSYLEKIRPIDKQLAYQVDKLLRAASIAAAADLGEDEDEADATRYGPRPDNLVGKAGSTAPTSADAEDVAGRVASGAQAAMGPSSQRAAADAGAGAGNGLYRAPRLNPVSMELDEARGKGVRNDQRRIAEASRRAARSDFVAELAAEVTGAPEELRTTMPGFDSMAAIKTRQKLQAREEEEEDIMTRVPLSRDQVKALKAQRRAGLSAASLVGDFADEVADLVAATADGDAPGRRPGNGNTLADLFARQKVSQRFGAEPVKPVSHAGDEDLPRRPDLQQRRAKFDAAAARKSVREQQLMDGGGDDDSDGDFGYDGTPGKRSRGGEEDDFYQAAKESAASRKKARAEAHRAPELPPPLPDAEAGTRARAITTAIQKNRGLTPHRRKDLKNPRKKNRIQYAKALVRRSGAVQDGSKTRDAGLAAYGGEATGVKSRISKSRKLQLGCWLLQRRGRTPWAGRG